MIINEFFYALQGEGSLAGTPTVFIRLAGCPLRCRWCDTAYARDFQAGTEQSCRELLDKAAEYPTRHLVVTGGEPAVHEGLSAFLHTFSEAGYRITLETAGFKFVPDLPLFLASISPKLSNASLPVSAAQGLCPDAVTRWMQAYTCQLKFVVDQPGDLDEIAGFLERLEGVDPERVFLMPQASRRQDYLEKSVWLAEYCLQTGFSFSPRLHVMLYDGQRGR